MDSEKNSNITASHEEKTLQSEQLAHLANAEDHDTSKLQAIRRNPLGIRMVLIRSLDGPPCQFRESGLPAIS